MDSNLERYENNQQLWQTITLQVSRIVELIMFFIGVLLCKNELKNEIKRIIN